MEQYPILSARNIKKSFGQTQALRGVSVDIVPGEVLAIMGPSGSGKSTLLHCLAVILGVDSGEIVFDRQQINQFNDSQRSILRRTAFGFIFQFGQLVPELTALDNVALPLLLNGKPRKKAYSDAQSWLDRVDLASKGNNLPGELSGGEAQRLAIAQLPKINPGQGSFCPSNDFNL